MNDCIFCKIVANKIPSHTVYEDEYTKVFLDIYGATDGHLIVIPKDHGETILSFDSEVLGKVWGTVQKVAAATEKAFSTKILSIGINHGEPKGVKHLHVHVLPRFEGDGGGIMQSLPGKKRTNEDFVGVAEKIKKYVG